MSKTKGYRELIKGAKTLADVEQFLHSARNAPVSPKSLRRCEKAAEESRRRFSKEEK